MAATGWVLYKWNTDPRYANFRVIYCISTRSGFPDNAKMREWGAFIVSSYGFLWLLWGKAMTEYYFAGYMAAWVLAGAYSLKKRVEQGSTLEPPLHPPERERRESDNKS